MNFGKMAIGAVCTMDWPVIRRLTAERPGRGCCVVLVREESVLGSRDGRRTNCRDLKERNLIIGKTVTLSAFGLRLPGSDTH